MSFEPSQDRASVPTFAQGWDLRLELMLPWGRTFPWCSTTTC